MFVLTSKIMIAGGLDHLKDFDDDTTWKSLFRNLHIEIIFMTRTIVKQRTFLYSTFNNQKFLTTTYIHTFLIYQIANPVSIGNLNSRACLCLGEGENHNNVLWLYK